MWNSSWFCVTTSSWKLSTGETDVSSLNWSVLVSAFIGMSSASFQRLHFFGWIFLSHQGFLFFSQTEHGLEVKVAKNVENINEYLDFSDLPLDKLAEFPLFLRFNLIKLVCSYSDHKDGKAWDTQSVEVKCQLLEEQLKLIKQEILNDSILYFGGHVDKNDSSRFAEHSDFLNYFRNRILPISHKPRGYHIFIGLCSDNGATKCVLSSLLQMQEIDCSSEIQINIHDTDQKRLPIAEISYWLHRKPAEQRERSLTIIFFGIESIVGIEEMFTHLKVVLSI